MATQQRCACLTLAILGLHFYTASAVSLMAIDFGSEFIKVCLVQPGRTPIAIVNNEMSKRKSPSLVGFINGERVVGEEAFSLMARFPEQILIRSRDLLGKSSDDQTIKDMLSRHLLPYEIVPHPTRSVATVKLGENITYSGEEAAASIFAYIKQITDAQAGGSVVDAVVTVPPYFSLSQRQAVVDAATLGGLHVLGLVHTHTAAALQFGIERDFTNRTDYIILYDMGSSDTVVSLVKYSTYNAKDGSKTKTVNQLEILDVDWDADLGSNDLDMLLFDHFAKVFQDKFKTPDVHKYPKSVVKLKKQVRRTKEMLSANSFAPCTCEELYDGKDLQASITRDDFEAMAADFFSRAVAPLKRILDRAAIPLANISAVELLGGGSRVPRLQAALSEALGGRQLDRHLDADEAPVMGAALFAANLSTSFRLRQFGISDFAVYGIKFQVDAISQGDASTGEESASVGKPRNLVPYGKRLPVKRLVHFSNVTSDALSFTISYNESTPHGLPPGVTQPVIAAYEVSNISSVIERFNHSGTVHLRFEMDYSGLLTLDKAEAVVDYEVMEEKIVEVPLEEGEGGEAGADKADGDVADKDTDTKKGDDKKGNDDKAKSKDEKKKEPDSKKKEPDSKKKDDGKKSKEEKKKEEKKAKEDKKKEDKKKAEEKKKEEARKAKDDKKKGDKKKDDKKGSKDEKADEEATVGADEAVNGTATTNTTKPATTVKRIMVPKKRQAKIPLEIGGQGFLLSELSNDDWSASEQVLEEFARKEAIKRDTAKAKNDLEAYIIKMRDRLYEDETLHQVTTEEQREEFRTQLTAMEDWLYMEGEHEAAAEFRKKLKELQAVGNPMTERAEELKLRPKLVETLRSSLDLRWSTAKAWEDTKPWINATERELVIAHIANFSKWFEEKVTEQEAREDTEEPAFRASQVMDKFQRVERVFERISNKRKPKPPPAPPAAANAAANATANATVDDGAAKDGGAEGRADPEAPTFEGSPPPEPGAGGEGEAESEQAAGGAGKDEELEGHDEL